MTDFFTQQYNSCSNPFNNIRWNYIKWDLKNLPLFLVAFEYYVLTESLAAFILAQILYKNAWCTRSSAKPFSLQVCVILTTTKNGIRNTIMNLRAVLWPFHNHPENCLILLHLNEQEQDWKALYCQAAANFSSQKSPSIMKEVKVLYSLEVNFKWMKKKCTSECFGPKAVFGKKREINTAATSYIT